MRTLFAKKTIWVYLAIGMVLLPCMPVNDTLGSGPTCPPCANPYFNGSGWACGGCVIDCGNCFKCDTSTIPPSCADKCDSLNCKYCPDCSTGCISKCDPNLCQMCAGGGCISRCDPSQCESCKNGHCAICNDDPNMKCCSPVWPGVCRERCKLVNGTTCSGSDDPYNSCAMEVGECTPSTRTEWSGVTEKTCNPRGCIGDCSDDTHWCSRTYQFVKTTNFTPCAICTNLWEGPDGIPYPGLIYHCYAVEPAQINCYSCRQGAIIAEPNVENDTCN